MERNNKIFYRYSLNDARHLGEVSLWRESHVANIECKQAIEEAITRDFNDNILDDNCAKSVIDKFGFERTNFVLRCTIRKAMHDGRYSDLNKTWAKQSRVADSNFRNEYAVNAHPTLLNGFVDEARQEWDKLGLFNSVHIDMSEDAKNYEGKILILYPDVLKDEYKSPNDQLFLATSGFGCDPNKIGRSVSGYFLSDEEFATFDRSSFYGVINEKYLPQWAEEKANQLLNVPTDDISMT